MCTHLSIVMEVSLEVCIDSLRPVYLCNSTVRTSGQNYIVSSGAILWYHDVTRHARQHAPIHGILYTYAQQYSVKINGCTYIPFLHRNNYRTTSIENIQFDYSHRWSQLWGPRVDYMKLSVCACTCTYIHALKYYSFKFNIMRSDR